MQIPSTIVAASLAGVTSKPAADKTHSAEASGLAAQPQVEQSGESNPDRDAQGQGDGLHRERSSKPSVSSQANDNGPNEFNHPAPNLPDEPPSQLDLLG